MRPWYTIYRETATHEFQLTGSSERLADNVAIKKSQTGMGGSSHATMQLG